MSSATVLANTPQMALFLYPPQFLLDAALQGELLEIFLFNQPYLGSCLIYYIFSNLPSYSNLEFVLRYGPLRGTNFFANTRDFKTCMV
jgi:hypothetical protein